MGRVDADRDNFMILRARHDAVAPQRKIVANGLAQQQVRGHPNPEGYDDDSGCSHWAPSSAG
jgi:hypothetical protein